MPYVWQGNKRLNRSGSRDESHVEPGDEFEPTEAELDTFGRYIEEVEPEEPDVNPGGSDDASREETGDETETPTCGEERSDGEPCGREVDSESDTCWQH